MPGLGSEALVSRPAASSYGNWLMRRPKESQINAHMRILQMPGPPSLIWKGLSSFVPNTEPAITCAPAGRDLGMQLSVQNLPGHDLQ